MRVLYVDDEADLRELAEFCLALDPDFVAQVTASGSEALELLATQSMDVILLDVMMPGMDGPALLLALRGSVAPQTPVIFVTARALPEEKKRLLDLGAIGVITKPFDPMTLAATVREILARARGG